MPPRRRNAPNGNADNLEGNNDGNFPQNFIAAVQALIHHEMEGGENHAPVNNPNRVIEQFRRFVPPKFNGKDGPLALKEWIRELERIFNHLECTDPQKVSCAIFQLSEEADHWWETHWRTISERYPNLSWAQFKEQISEKYFPDSYKEQKEMEFFNFTQGTLSVVEYERKFTQLSRYARHLVDTDAKRARKFRRGLRPEIGGVLAAQGLDVTYGEMVRRAQDVASTLRLEDLAPKPSHVVEKRKWNDTPQGRGEHTNKKTNIGSNGGTSDQGAKLLCMTCGKNHNGECLVGKNVCFWCKTPGHNTNACPKRNRKETEKKGNARVYAMIQNEEEDAV